MPNALGILIAESDLKDLGMHTELMSDGYLNLYKAGRLPTTKSLSSGERRLLHLYGLERTL